MNTAAAAASRVTAFLHRRAQMTGLDPEDIAGLDGGRDAGGTALTVSDLRALVEAVAEESVSGFCNRETFDFVVTISNVREMYDGTTAIVASRPGLSDWALGEAVVARWREIVRAEPDRTPDRLGSTLGEWAERVGSWNRINRAEVGAYVRRDT